MSSCSGSANESWPSLLSVAFKQENISSSFTSGGKQDRVPSSTQGSQVSQPTPATVFKVRKTWSHPQGILGD
jgi:hypothetical protein